MELGSKTNKQYTTKNKSIRYTFVQCYYWLHSQLYPSPQNEKLQFTEQNLFLARTPRGGTPIWNRRRCSSEILNLTPTSFPVSLFSSSLGRWNKDPGRGWSRDHPESGW